MLAVGVVVNFEGVAASCHVTFPRTPVGAWVVVLVDGADVGIVEMNVESPLPAQLGNARCRGDVPVGLVGHGGIHGCGTPYGNGVAGGTGTAHLLGVGMAGEHQDLHRPTRVNDALPVLLRGEPRAGPRAHRHFAEGAVGRFSTMVVVMCCLPSGRPAVGHRQQPREQHQQAGQSWEQRHGRNAPTGARRTARLSRPSRLCKGAVRDVTTRP